MTSQWVLTSTNGLEYPKKSESSSMTANALRVVTLEKLSITIIIIFKFIW